MCLHELEAMASAVEAGRQERRKQHVPAALPNSCRSRCLPHSCPPHNLREDCHLLLLQAEFITCGSDDGWVYIWSTRKSSVPAGTSPPRSAAEENPFVKVRWCAHASLCGWQEEGVCGGAGCVGGGGPAGTVGTVAVREGSG